MLGTVLVVVLRVYPLRSRCCGLGEVEIPEDEGRIGSKEDYGSLGGYLVNAQAMYWRIGHEAEGNLKYNTVYNTSITSFASSCTPAIANIVVSSTLTKYRSILL